eukprot:gene21103-1169_t
MADSTLARLARLCNLGAMPPRLHNAGIKPALGLQLSPNGCYTICFFSDYKTRKFTTLCPQKTACFLKKQHAFSKNSMLSLCFSFA